MNNLIRMVYVSTTSNPVDPSHGGIPKDVGRVLMQSRKNNPSRQIGGVLYFSNNFYLQCLEGEQQHVDTLYKKIARDPRHTRVQTLSVKRVEHRLFSDWSMKYVAMEQQVNQVLRQFGIASFNPYEFNEQVIDKMLALFVVADDKTAKLNQGYVAGDKPARQGFLSRLFKRSKAA